MTRPVRVFQVTNMWPSDERPNWGVFIRSQVESLSSVGVENVGLYEIEGWRDRLRSRYVRALRELPRAIAAVEPDLVHIHHGLSAIGCGLVRDRPLVVSFCGNDLLGCPDVLGRISQSSRAMAAWCRHAARRAQVVIVKSPEMATRLEGWPNVEVVPNGVDLDLFRPIPRDEARARLGWPVDAHILLFPANPAEPRKNFALAQACSALLAREGLPVRLEWIYGRTQAEVALSMAAADVMLNPSFHEGSPNAVKESMACNLPVITADCGDCRIRLANCAPGAVSERTPEAFAAAIRAVLLDGHRSNGRDEIAPLNLSAIAHRVRAVYDRALTSFATSR